MSSLKLTALRLKEINEVLGRFGLNDKERRVYLKLLAFKPTTLTPLARSVALPLTTVQAVLSRLVDFGVVNVTKRRSRQVYEAAEPVTLKQLMERKVEEAKEIVPFLNLLRGQAESKVKIRVFYRERIAEILQESLQSREKMVYEMVAAKEFQDFLGERFHYTKRRVEKKIFLKSLRVESREIKKYSRLAHVRELREAKFLPRELTFQASIMFWDTTVAFFSTREEGLAWVVESRVIRQAVGQIFDLLWSLGRAMETAV